MAPPRQSPPRGTRCVPRLLLLLRDPPRLLLLAALIVSATVAVSHHVTNAPVTYVQAARSMRFGPGYSASVNPATNPPAPVVNWNGAPLAHDTHQGTIPPLTYVPATQSVQLGPEYSVSLNPATDPPSLAIVDYNGRPVAPTYNADGSATVAGYTAHRNGTITGPGGLAIYLGAGNALFSMGTTTVLKNGTIVDGSGKKLVPTKRPDGSYTAGDLTGWPSIGIIIGSGGAVINAGAPLTVTVDGSVAFALDVAPIPLPGVAISVNPATRSLRFGGYTLLLNGNKPSLLDCLSRPVRTTANPDGSLSLGNYTLYKNGTIAAPDGIAIDTVGPNTGLRVGTTTVLINGTVLDGSGAKITPTGPNEDGSYSAGDVKGWTNGTIISTKSGVVLYAGAPLALTADGRVTLASPTIPTAAPSAGVAVSSAAAASPPTDAAAPSTDAASPPANAAAPTAGATSLPDGATSPPAGASTPAAAPPSPKTAGSLASPPTALTALITLALSPLVFI